MRTVRNRVSIFIILLAAAPHLSAQININGFYNQQFLSAEHSCSGIFFTDFNNDGVKDAVLINSGEKHFGIFRSGKNGYEPYQKKFFYFNISDIKEFAKRPDGSILYLFVSRAERIAGLAAFTPYGTLKLLNRIRFDSYPNNVIVGDVDDDGKNEALVYGEAFTGLALLEEKGLVLHPQFINEEMIFNGAVFADFDYDGLVDIAAHNALDDSIIFYSNDAEGWFNTRHTLKLTHDVVNLQAYDINGDYFTDLIYANNSGIEVMYGDSVSSYVNKEVLVQPGEKVNEYTLTDFNLDGFPDLAYSTSKNGVFVRYHTTNGFTHPVCYCNTVAPISIYSYQTKSNATLAVLSQNGVNITRKNNELNENTSIKAGCEPHILKYSVYPDSFIRELAVIDTTNRNLGIMLYGSGKFDWYEEFNLAMPYKNLLSYRIPDRREYYLYNRKGRIIEAIRTFAGETIRTQMYTYAGICDLGIVNDISPMLVALVNEEGALGLMEFDQRDDKYIPTFRKDLMSGIVDARFLASDSVMVYAWKSANGFLTLNELNVKGSFGISKTLATLTADTANVPYIRKVERAFGGHIFASGGNGEFYYMYNGEALKFTGKSAARFTAALKYNRVVKWHKGTSSFLIYNGDNRIELVRLDAAAQKVIPIKTIESGKVNSYFSTAINNTDYLFSITEGGSRIKIKKIE